MGVIARIGVVAIMTISAASPAAAADLCFARASRLAHVEPDILLAMSFVESRWHPDRVNSSNANGTEDVCLMQVNSIHHDRLAAIGVTRDRLLGNWCICLLAGAQVLGEMMDAVGGDVWTAVAAYNAGPNNIAGGRRYATKVRQVVEAVRTVRRRLAGPPTPQSPSLPAEAIAGDAQLDALAAQLRGAEEPPHAP
ncbi:lytic transglycosylase domain-containing protein [Mycobacterium sp. KBS0706]|uniref:lytic transglycosylase domain-containing protein n=1 Tax=Mycobacterium sp. KBS0706 TaxID=2578109 RepID=UPI00110FB3B8|nr:lytic transglycosylase domain-containing protein [Mycobacterium sp. KBS0706]TSD83278.1 lytic transglycosylase domain-containing protein [Mycobacterium sp. KBS0706]